MERSNPAPKPRNAALNPPATNSQTERPNLISPPLRKPTNGAFKHPLSLNPAFLFQCLGSVAFSRGKIGWQTRNEKNKEIGKVKMAI